jgi:hypothetical protein
VTRPVSSEIDPRAANSFMASFAARQGTTSGRARHLAAALIRCMDSRDVTGADALITRVSRGPDLDAVMAWVWRIEADRAARRRVYRASAAWRSGRRPTARRRLAAESGVLLLEVVAVLGSAMHEPAPPETPGPLCGTYAAFRRHEDHGELIDGDCWKAARAYWRDAKRRYRAAAADHGEELADAA